MMLTQSKKPTNWGQAKRCAIQIRPKAVGSGIFGRFSYFDKFRSEVTGGAISGVSSAAADYFGVDVRATFGASGLNSGPIILLFGRPDPFYVSLLSSIYLHFAADRKELATSYLANLWGQLSCEIW